MILSQDEFRKKLRQRFAEMVEKNSSYSLRALAMKTGLSASILSRVINGKRNLSLETMLKVSQILDLDLETDAHQRKTDILGLESFKVIADWYHFPILELIKTRGFQSDEKWIARRLKLPLAIVQAALDRLQRLGLIERVDGQIKSGNGVFLKTTDDQSSVAIRKHHKQMMEKAVEALDDNLGEREYRGLNFAFEPSDLPEAKKMIREFYKKFGQKFGKNLGKEVYQLNLQFFKLTKEE